MVPNGRVNEVNEKTTYSAGAEVGTGAGTETETAFVPVPVPIPISASIPILLILLVGWPESRVSQPIYLTATRGCCVYRHYYRGPSRDCGRG
jgi:hypothetical protein